MPSNLIDFFSGILTPQPRDRVMPSRIDLSPINDAITFQQKRGDVRSALEQEKALTEAKLRAASSSDAEKRRQQLAIESMKETGRGSRAESKAKGAKEKLDWEKEKYSKKSQKDDDKVWSELQKAEAEGQEAAVASLKAELERRGYKFESAPSADGTAPSAGDKAPPSPEDESSPPMKAGTPSAPTARFPDAASDEPSATIPEGRLPEAGIPKQYKAPKMDLTPFGVGSIVAPGDSEGVVQNAKAAASGMSAVQSQADKDIQALGDAMNAPKRPQPAPPKTIPGVNPLEDFNRAKDNAAPQMQELEKGLKSQPTGGYSVTKDGKTVYSSRSGEVSYFNKRKVNETFKTLDDNAGDKWEAEAARIGKETAMGAIGSMGLEDAIKLGRQAYQYEVNRRYKKDRVGTIHGGPQGGPAVNGKALQREAGGFDDLHNYMKSFAERNVYKEAIKLENAATMAEELMQGNSATMDAVALGQVIKATEGGRATDADRESYLRGQGALARLQQRFSEATKTGEGVVMGDELRGDLAAIANMNKSAAQNRKVRIADTFKKTASGLSIKRRYGDEKSYNADVDAMANSLAGGDESGGPRPAKAPPSEDIKTKTREALEEYRRQSGGL